LERDEDDDGYVEQEDVALKPLEQRVEIDEYDDEEQKLQ